MGSFSDDLDELEETTPTPTTPKAAGFEAILLQKDDWARPTPTTCLNLVPLQVSYPVSSP